MDKSLKRKLSNRESARKSRMKKQERLQDLTKEIGELQKEIGIRRVCVDASEKKFVEVESKNEVLRAQKVELERRLESLESILGSRKRSEVDDDDDDLDVLNMIDIGEIGGCFELDSPEIPEHMVNPWRLPLMDCGGLFQC